MAANPVWAKFHLLGGWRGTPPRLCEDGSSRSLHRRDLARHGSRQSQLVTGNRINAHGRAQSGNFQSKLLVKLHGLRARSLEFFQLVTHLDALEMLPGIKQDTSGQQR